MALASGHTHRYVRRCCFSIFILLCNALSFSSTRNHVQVVLAQTSQVNVTIPEDPRTSTSSTTAGNWNDFSDLREYPPNYCPPPYDASSSSSDHQQQVYRVGVLAIRGIDQAYAAFNTTFGDYLTATVAGPHEHALSSNMRFEMVPLNFAQVFERVEQRQVDFIFVNPSAFSCMESEHGVQSLVSLITRRIVGGKTYDLTRFGGVIATLQNNSDVNRIQDLKDKIVAAASISGLGSGQMQFREMQRAGLHYLHDPKQVVFTSNQGKIVQGLLDGTFDVGLIRTDMLEHSHGDDEPMQDFLQRFKIINPQPQPQLLDNGVVFPFVSSTPLYPEWNLAALPHVPQDVSYAVLRALIAVSQHAKAGYKIQQCEQGFANHSSASDGAGGYCDSLPLSLFLESNDNHPHNSNNNNTILYSPHAYPCDTTRTIAKLAHAAMTDGEYAGWRTSLSFASLRSMQQATGFKRMDQATGQWKCIRHSTLYQAITCPKGYFRKTRSRVERGCEQAGLPCPNDENFQCLCKPCKKGYDVDVFPITIPGGLNDTVDHHPVGCAKMSLCGTTLHRQALTLHAVDNLQRNDDNQTILLWVVVHEGEHTHEVPVVPTGDEHVYEFNISANVLGVTDVEIYWGDTQISESPLRVLVTQKDCAAETGSQHFEPNEKGDCVCKAQYVTLGGSCISIFILLPALFAPFCVMVGVISLLYVQQKRREADSIWKVNPDDLKYSQPPVVLGQGTFGVVWLAEIHGTKVAVKKVLPPRDKKTTISIHGAAASSNGGASGQGSSRIDVENGGSSGGGGNQSRSDVASSSLGNLSGYQAGSLSDDFLISIRGHSAAHKRRNRGLVSTATLQSSRLLSLCFPEPDRYEQLKLDFIQEMRLLSKLRHPCVTCVLGAIVSRDTEPLLVMEHMKFGSLYDLLHNETVVMEGEVLLSIMRDIAQGLRYLHSSDPPVVHGDLKSRNVLVSSGFRAKVADFGLSQKKKNGNAFGTPYFMAPELLLGNPNSTASDMYAIGMVLWELYSRKNPYEGLNAEAVLKLVCDPLVNKRPMVSTSCPPEIFKLMKQCWKANPRERPTAEDLDERLKYLNVENIEPIRPYDDTNPLRKRPSNSCLLEEPMKGSDRHAMLYDVFPEHVASSLAKGEKVEPESHDSVSIVYVELVGLSQMAGSCPPSKISDLLSETFRLLADLAQKHGLFTVETIGDSYMAVANLTGNQPDHGKRAVEFALEAAQEVPNESFGWDVPAKSAVQIQVGFHVGPVVTSVVGSVRPRFSLFGQSVSLASSLGSQSKPQQIQCSGFARDLLRQQAPDIVVLRRGEIDIKGKGRTKTYWVHPPGYQTGSERASSVSNPL